MSFKNMEPGTKLGLVFAAMIVVAVVWNPSMPTSPGIEKAHPVSCGDLSPSSGKSGVYEIYPDSDHSIKTRCQFEAEGAWTLVASISDKSSEHTSEDAINEHEFFIEGKFGKLSDANIRNLAKHQEFRFQCGSGEIREVYIKNHVWRSNINNAGYDGQYSLDKKQWLPFHERGAGPWKGFDNYAVTFESGANPKAAFAYNIGAAGCFSMSDGGKPASGFLWAR